MDDHQISYMVNRFLSWKLPENLNPDGGIRFDPIANKGGPHEYRHHPTGTNMLDATQAEAMVRYMLEGLPSVMLTKKDDEPPTQAQCLRLIKNALVVHRDDIDFVVKRPEGTAHEPREIWIPSLGWWVRRLGGYVMRDQGRTPIEITDKDIASDICDAISEWEDARNAGTFVLAKLVETETEAPKDYTRAVELLRYAGKRLFDEVNNMQKYNRDARQAASLADIYMAMGHYVENYEHSPQ